MCGWGSGGCSFPSALACVCVSYKTVANKVSVSSLLGVQASVCAVMGQWNWPDSCWYAFKSKQELLQVVYACKIHI